MTRQHRTGLALLIACAVFSAGAQAKGDASKLGVSGTPLTSDAVVAVRPVRITPEKAANPRIIT